MEEGKTENPENIGDPWIEEYKQFRLVRSGFLKEFLKIALNGSFYFSSYGDNETFKRVILLSGFQDQTFES